MRKDGKDGSLSRIEGGVETQKKGNVKKGKNSNRANHWHVENGNIIKNISYVSKYLSCIIINDMRPFQLLLHIDLYINTSIFILLIANVIFKWLVHAERTCSSRSRSTFSFDIEECLYTNTSQAIKCCYRIDELREPNSKQQAQEATEHESTRKKKKQERKKND